MIGLDETLNALLKGIAPVSHQGMNPEAARGCVLAKSVITPEDLPRNAIALRAGYAVHALDLVGASPHSPIWLPECPIALRPGDSLPTGTDAILPEDGFLCGNGITEVIRAVAPGENARLEGHDLASGTTLVETGTRLNLAQILVLSEAGITTIVVRVPKVSLPADNNGRKTWLAAVLRAAGCLPVEAGSDADLHLFFSEEARRSLALFPGETTQIRQSEKGLEIHLPTRFDGMIAGVFALVLPVIEALSGARLPRKKGVLTRKIASSVGMSEIAILRAQCAALTPLMTGAITLQTLALGNGIALIPPDCEGFPAGETLEYWALDFGI